MLVEPMVHAILLVIRRQLLRLSPIPLLWQSTFMLKMHKGGPQTCMPTSSPNTQGILQRSRPSRGVWVLGTWLVPLSFLISLILMLFQSKIPSGNRELTSINLLKNWGMLTLSQCQNWQRDSFNYACTNNLASMEGAKTLMTNSCDVLLVNTMTRSSMSWTSANKVVLLISRLRLMKCLPLVTPLLQPSRDSLRFLPKKALPRSQMRMSVVLQSKSLPSPSDWQKYLHSQVNAPAIFLKG